MTTINEATRSAQDQFLATVRQSQEAVIDAIAAWAQTVKEITPATPPIPNAEALPKPREVIENAFDFAQKLLDAQRDFAENVLTAASPVLDKSAPNKAKKAA